MKDAERRQFDLVRVFALDPFSNQGIEAVFEYTAALDQCEIAFWSYCEPMLSTTGPMATLYKAIIAWAAGYRNERHSENLRLGQARKRAQVADAGETYQHGRRSLGEEAGHARELAARDLSQRKIANELSIPLGNLSSYLKTS